MARRDGLKYRGTYRGAVKETQHQKTRVQVKLSCGHDMFFGQPIPKVGDTILCDRCRIGCEIWAMVDEIRVRCTECRYSRGFGQATLTADTYAAKHAVTRGHRVEVTKGSSVLSVKGDRSAQLEINSDAHFTG